MSVCSLQSLLCGRLLKALSLAKTRGSRNGTFVNGERLVADQPLVLHENDTITLAIPSITHPKYEKEGEFHSSALAFAHAPPSYEQLTSLTASTSSLRRLLQLQRRERPPRSAVR